MNKIGKRAAALAVAMSGLMGLSLSAASTASAVVSCDRYIVTPSNAMVPSSPSGINCQLGIGNQSGGVGALQDALVWCYGKDIRADGIFGPQTKTALQQVQQQVGVTADGIYGPNTRRAMLFAPYSIGLDPCIRVS